MFVKIATKLAAWLTAYVIAKTTEGNSPCHNDAPVRVVEMARMRPDLIEKLEREVAQPYVSPTTTDIMAGYIIGVQAVLNKLRSGYATN